MKKPEKFDFYANGLDYVRLFAALQVALGHFLTLYWWWHEDYQVSQPVLWGIRMVNVRFYGVVILFALSGYLTAHSLEKKKSFREFFPNRLKRVYPGLWCGVLFSGLTLVVLGLVKREQLKELIQWILLEGLGIAYTPQAFKWLGSQSINGVLWTVLVEIQFYILAFLFIRWHNKMKLTAYSIVVLVCVALNIGCGEMVKYPGCPELLAKLLERSVVPYLLWFILGMYVCRFREKIIPFLKHHLCSLFLLFAVIQLLLERFSQGEIGYYTDILTGIFLPFLALGTGYALGTKRVKWDLSYGIFLYHWPILNILIETGLMKNTRASRLIVPYLAAVLAMGAFSWLILERRFVRRWYSKIGSASAGQVNKQVQSSMGEYDAGNKKADRRTDRKIRVVMIGADRSVHGGVSAVVNNYHRAGLDQKVKLTYIGTMVDGGKGRKLAQAVKAYLCFWPALLHMDILHVNMAADASFYRKRIFIETAAFFHKKILIHEHGGDFQSFYYEKSDEAAKKKIRNTLHKADVFVVLSDQWADFFRLLVDADKITILENAVPIPWEGKQDYANRNLLFLGRICREKGIGELLEVMPQITERFPDCRLYLGGIWADRELKEKSEKLKDTVTWLGWIGEEEKQDYMKRCSIFILPTYFEGQPISLLEAMAEGMAVLTTAVGGIPQIMEDGVQGRLVREKDKEALAEGLEELLSDEEIRREYGIAARKRAEEKYDIVKNVEKLYNIYTRIYNSIRIS